MSYPVDEPPSEWTEVALEALDERHRAGSTALIAVIGISLVFSADTEIRAILPLLGPISKESA
jgi:hypothetical protein